MTMAEMNMLPPDGAMEAGPYAEVDALAEAVMIARGVDPAMLEGLPPLSDEAISPELRDMLAAAGMMGAPSDEDMWSEANAAEAAAIPCAECPDPQACREAGMCQLGLV